MATRTTARTLAQFLLGSRDAIASIAESRAATVAALVFVLSAGFAREYDGEYLLAEPWHFLRPLGASTVSGTILFLLIHPWIRGARDSTGPMISFTHAYRRFMTCFWMTAPLAWLYAIPYERFMSPADAVVANLWTLALVAAWRVILITRVACVLYNAKTAPIFFIVMLFADVVAFLVVVLIPAPVLDFMGGVQHTERDAILAGINFNIQVLTFLSSPIWIIGAIAAWSTCKRAPADLPPSPFKPKAWHPLCIIALAIWIPPLLIAQPEQARRHEVVQLFESDDIPAALAALSKYEANQLPLRWELPPRTGYRERTPDLEQIRTTIESQPTAPWVAAEYAEKISRPLMRRFMPFTRTWSETLARINDQFPPEFSDQIGYNIDTQTDLDQLLFVREHLAAATPEDREALDTLVSRLTEMLAAPEGPPAPSTDPLPPPQESP